MHYKDDRGRWYCGAGATSIPKVALRKEFTRDQGERSRFLHPDVPRELRRRLGGGTVIRVLAPLEAKKKYAAARLIEAAAAMRADPRRYGHVEDHHTDSVDVVVGFALGLEASAFALWPAPKKRKL